MIPILASSYPYTGNGLGGLSDTIECVVTHEINGIYELMLKYPITGEHYGELIINYFVMAKPDNLTQAQPFRIYRITKPLNGIVTVYARHISYDMAGIIVEPFTAPSLADALDDLPDYCTPSLNFTIQSTKTVASALNLKEPRPLWRLLGGQEGSFLDVYGGEWDFDGLTATLKNELGTDRGVEIRYGKNMTELEQDASLESTYAGVYPYWYDGETNTLVVLPEKYIAINDAAVSSRLLILDCSGDFEEAPSVTQLRDRANAYIIANSVGAPKVSWNVSFAMLNKAGEYEAQAVLEQVQLGDTIKVKYEALGVDAVSRAVMTEYDVLKDQYANVTIGSVKQNLASIIVGNNEELNDKIKDTKSSLERAIDSATDFIKNGAGYMRLIYDNANNLTEIISMDDPDISQAQKVWRWNNGGFGFSSTGYNGTYGLALTQDGQIVADYITTGTLSANRVRTGLITDEQGNNSWNLDTGDFTLTKGTIHIVSNAAESDLIVLQFGNYTLTMTPKYVLYTNGADDTAVKISSDSVKVYNEFVDGSAEHVGVEVTGDAVNLYVPGDGADEDILRGKLDLTDGLVFYNANGGVAAEYPSAYKSRTSLGTITPYSSRGTVDSGGFYRVGSQCNINFVFTSSYSATNAPRITGMSAVPQFESPLMCYDKTDKVNVPCYVNTSGNIYLATCTSGHQYLIGGTFII